MKAIPLANRNFSVTYYQTRKEVFWTLRLGKPENVNNEKQMPIKLKKNARFVKKNAKIRDIKTETIPLPLKTMQ